MKATKIHLFRYAHRDGILREATCGAVRPTTYVSTTKFYESPDSERCAHCQRVSGDLPTMEAP